MTSNTVLFASVVRLLRVDEDLQSVVYMWRRSRLSFPFAVGAAVAMAVASVAFGVESAGSIVALMFATAGIAVLASTEYRVLAQTQRGFVLCRASRVRRVGTEVLRRFPLDLDIERVGNSFVFTEWAVDGVRYGLPKRDEASMMAMSV